MARFGTGLLALLLAACAMAGPVAPVAVAQKPAAQKPAGPAPAVQVAGKGWANDRSDLPKDPDYTLGQLANGMRYLILPNRNPPGTTAMRLVIDGGSMQEQPGEEGSAHFLEHMAFRGTTRFPDGEIQRALGQLGLEMGRDVNASTGSDGIIFKFDLAHSEPNSMFTGLMILRQIASELLLDRSALDVERGVVLAEERMRASPQLTTAIAALKSQVGDHPYGRPPIGKREAILAMTPAVLRKYYEEYFRPERATLILIGDVDPAQVLPIIKDQFGDWKGKGPAGGDPKPLTGKPAGAPETSIVVGDGQSSGALRLSWQEPYKPLQRTKAERRQQLIDTLASRAVALRMQGLMDAAGKPAGGASPASPARINNVWQGWIASVSGITDLPKAIDVLVKANRQAVQYGISQTEFDRAVGLARQQYEQAAKAGRSDASVPLADIRAQTLTADPVFVSDADALKLFEEAVKTITLADVNAVYKAHFNGEPTIFYSGVAAPAGGEAGLRAMVDKALAQPVAPYVDAAVKPWPYTDFGPAGKVAERREAADLGVTMVRFENGVRLTVKPLSVRKDEISARVMLGRGRLDLPRAGMDASDFGLSMWGVGGVNKLTLVEQSRTLAGKRVIAVPGQDDDNFYLDNLGATTRESLQLQMQVFAALVADPAYRVDEWDRLLKQSDDSDTGNFSTPSAALNWNLDRLLHAGDIRWAFNTPELRHSWKAKDAVAFMKPIVDTSPIEIVVVGDTDVEATIAAVASTFGALPPRKEKPEPPGLRDVKFPAPTPTPIKITHKGRADQAIMMMAWPTGQGLLKDLHAERVADLLARLLQDHATLKFRLGEGATYSPSAFAAFSEVLPDYGYIGIVCELPPERIGGAMADVQALADDLAGTDILPEELDRGVGPRAEQAKREVASSTSFWMNYLAGAQTDPRRLELIRTEESDYRSITAAEIRAAAAKWLRADTAFRVEVVAEGK